MKQTPYNVCLCSQHENFKFKIQRIYEADPIVFVDFKSLSTVEKLIICEKPKDECYLSKCKSCSKRHKLRTLLQQLSEEQKLSVITWFEWKTISNSGFKQVSKVSNESTLSELYDIFLYVCDAFLLHLYVQRTHTEKFKHDKQQALHEDSTTAVLQIDFAENFKCFEQNATQGGHYGYNMV